MPHLSTHFLLRPLLCLAILLSAESQADVVTPISRVQEYITIWDAPGGNKLGELRVGQYLDYLNTVEAYHEVALGNGASGYVLRDWSTVLSLAAQPAAATGQLAIHFLDTERGGSTLAVCPDGSSIFIDAGAEQSIHASLLRDYLQDSLGGSRHIDRLLLTQSAPGDATALKEQLRGFSVGKAFYLGTPSKQFVSHLKDSRDLLAFASATSIQATAHDPADSPNTNLRCGAAEIFMLAVNVSDDDSGEAKNTLLLKIQYGEFAAILTVGESRKPEREALERFDEGFLNVDVLQAVTPWRLATPTATRWIDTLKPEAAILNAGSVDFDGHPWAAVVTLLENHTLIDPGNVHSITTARGNPGNFSVMTESRYTEQIYATADSGHVVVISDGREYWIESELP